MKIEPEQITIKAKLGIWWKRRCRYNKALGKRHEELHRRVMRDFRLESDRQMAIVERNPIALALYLNEKSRNLRPISGDDIYS